MLLAFVVVKSHVLIVKITICLVFLNSGDFSISLKING
ncbi:hypothetical protein VEx25_A1006 [Vibrio antiquarius]|uniref:Uncharacterized protein n=2 Tax=Vibrio antiquarius (strain Ex25) TaxID=150340 RepID=A0ACA6QRS4_VIBAE|nr:hypothetical protein VEA_000455 [Vibrio antiquarius]EDN58578.1 hypothetical protein VEx25_A1006 [Vibrio antiquarius]